jgi:TPR repeat protein
MDKQLLQAAEKGDAGSQWNLGVLYENGLDDNYYAVEGNRPEAVRWLLAAAEQGLPRAQIKLAEMYADGPELRNGLQVVPPGDDELARHTSPQGSTNTLHKGKRVNSGSSVRQPFR